MVMAMSKTMVMLGADDRELDPGSNKLVTSCHCRRSSNNILVGVCGINARGGIGLADHDGQADGVPSTLQEDVPLDLEAELLVVGVVGERAGLEIHGSVFGVGLDYVHQTSC